MLGPGRGGSGVSSAVSNSSLHLRDSVLLNVYTSTGIHFYILQPLTATQSEVLINSWTTSIINFVNVLYIL